MAKSPGGGGVRRRRTSLLGRYLKNINQSTLKSCSFTIPLVIDGGWLIHQLSLFKGCNNYGEVTKEFVKLIPENREVTVSFHGDVKLKAEDTDIVCLLVHHFNSEHHNKIYLTSKKGTYSIREITSHLDHKKRRYFI